MHIVRFLIASVAVALGLMFTVVVAMVGLAVFTLRRLLGHPAARPVFKARFQRGPMPPRATHIPRDGAIDIEATEIK